MPGKKIHPFFKSKVLKSFNPTNPNSDKGSNKKIEYKISSWV